MLHVADISNPRLEQQITAVNDILAQLHLEDKPKLLVLNKIDKVDPETAKNLAFRLNAIPISALQPSSLINLINILEEKVFKI